MPYSSLRGWRRRRWWDVARSAFGDVIFVNTLLHHLDLVEVPLVLPLLAVKVEALTFPLMAFRSPLLLIREVLNFQVLFSLSEDVEGLHFLE